MKKLMSLLFAFLTVIISVCDVLFVADADTSELEKINDTIERYYELSYDMWWNLEEVSFADVLDMDSVQSHNKVVAMKECVFNWKYSIENGYYEGQREKNLVEIQFINTKIVDDLTANVSVNLIAKDEKAIYPFFVILGENFFVLKNKNGKWLISNHKYNDTYYYEKSITEVLSPDYEKILSDYADTGNSNLTVNLVEEIHSGIVPYSYPYTDYNYSAERAVAYANNFVNNWNTFFKYLEGEDCTNFVSQCVSYGFGSDTDYHSPSSYRMVNTGVYSSGWYATANGLNYSWENVSNHWNYMFSTKLNSAGPRVKTVTVATMQNGDVMQIDFYSDGTFDHSCILVDAINQKFAQHSYNRYRYLADYSGTKRLYRPKFFREY